MGSDRPVGCAVCAAGEGSLAVLYCRRFCAKMNQIEDGLAVSHFIGGKMSQKCHSRSSHSSVGTVHHFNDL